MPINIIVCVKQVLDISYPLEIEEGKKQISQKGKKVPLLFINPADRCALEEALKIKKQTQAKITALTFGPKSAASVLEFCLARGADKAIHICHPPDLEPDLYTACEVLGNEILQQPYDLIFCGDKSIDHASGQVGPILAEMLDLPQITRAGGCHLQPINDTPTPQLRANRFLERGDRQEILCPLPVLVTVPTISNEPPYVSTARLQGIDKSLTIQREFHSKPENDFKFSVETVTPPKPRARKMSSPPKQLTAAERMKFMMSGGQKKKKDSGLFQGSAAQAADKVVSYLQENGFL